MKRIVPLYQSSLQPNATAPFSYVPKNKAERAVGVLIASNTEVSLAFKGGTHLVFHKQDVGKSTRTTPDSRIIPINETLNGALILGKVKNTKSGKSANTVSVYLIVKQ